MIEKITSWRCKKCGYMQSKEMNTCPACDNGKPFYFVTTTAGKMFNRGNKE